jgi:hypothetical protein
MRRMRRRIAALLAVGLVAGGAGCSARATVFDTPAAVGDREVDLRWTAESDDPLYTGNLKIFREGRATVGTAEYTQLLFPQFGERLWLLGRAGDAVVSLLPTTDDWIPGPTLPPLDEGGVEVACAALHPAGHLLLAGLADGRIGVWRTGSSAPPEIFAGHDGACRGIAFRPLAVAADSSFVSVGEDGYLIQWSRPGTVRRDTLVDAAGLWTVAFDREGERAAIGRSDGGVDVWQVTSGISLLRQLPGPAGRRVVQLVWSQDGRRLAGADDLGGVWLWEVLAARLLGTFEPAAPGPTYIAFTPQKSDYIAFARGDGVVGVLDGHTARAFKAEGELDRPITGFALTPDGLSGFYGGSAGQVEWWHQGPCIPSPATPDCFGGYIIWRGPSDRPEELIRLRTYEFGDTTWLWSSSDSLRAFVDPDSVVPRGGDPDLEVPGPHNGIPFYYSITKYYRRFLTGGEFEVYVNSQDDGYYRDPPVPQANGFYRDQPGGDPMPLVPRVDGITDAPLLGKLYVAPDPYRENDPDGRFGVYGPPQIWFYNLPLTATIRIYTMNGELVRTIHHVQRSGGVSGGAIAWDLKNDHGRDVTSGVYPYAVEAPSGESRSGFLTIVR